MPIDINAFRAISAKTNGALQEFVEVGRPLSASVVSQLVTYADEIARAAAERFFNDLCRVEAMVVSEVSRRMDIYKGMPNVQGLMERYVGEGVDPAGRYGDERDMTNLNLGIMARLASKGTLECGRIDDATNARLEKHKAEGVDPRQIGDMIRNNDLTVNCHLSAIMGLRQNGAALPKYIDESLYRELTSLRTGERREAYLADLARRLPPDAVDSARKRLDQAIDYAIKLAAENRVVKNDDFEKRAMQKRLLEPEINAGNVVKSVGNFQLQMEPIPKNKDQARRQVVRRANIQAKSFFMRDMYGRVTKPDWLS